MPSPCMDYCCRLLWVVMVELAWVSVLLFWSQQTALNDDGEADSWAASATAAVAVAADEAAAPQATMERSPSQEMRVLLVRMSCICHVHRFRCHRLCMQHVGIHGPCCCP